MLVHDVYFTLEDTSEESFERLLSAARTYLEPHDGVRFFAVGRRDPELERPVNDRDFHVGLHVAFESRAAHDAYQVSELHQRFIDEQKGNWREVRVFDTAC